MRYPLSEEIPVPRWSLWLGAVLIIASASLGMASTLSLAITKHVKSIEGDMLQQQIDELKEEVYIQRLQLKACQDRNSYHEEVTSLYERALVDAWIPGDRVALWQLIMTDLENGG